MTDLQRLVWFKTSLVPASSAQISALSPSAQFGISIFEGVRAYWSVSDCQLYLFRLHEHIDRLYTSSKLAGFTDLPSPTDIYNHLIDCIVANDYKSDLSIRIVFFLDGEGSWSSQSPTQMLIAPILKNRLSETHLPRLRATFTSWMRINDLTLPPRVKLGANYANSRYAYLESLENGFDLPFFVDLNGYVSESSGSCIFIIKNSVLYTPPFHASVLESITRETIIQLAAYLNLSCIVAPFYRTNVYDADEVFVCGSAAEISPVTRVDRFDIGTMGTPGPITLKLLAAYHNLVSGTISIDPNWLTSVY